MTRQRNGQDLRQTRARLPQSHRATEVLYRFSEVDCLAPCLSASVANLCVSIAGKKDERYFILTVVLALCLTACARQNPEATRQAAVLATTTRLQGCLPSTTPNAAPPLAIAEITRLPQETSVRLVAFAGKEAVEFSLPVYLMSRGRWLINEKERAYLLDENCREYKLRDRKTLDGQPFPPDGKVRLKPGEAFAFKLSFQALPAEARLGALVFGATALPFVLLTP